MQLKHWKLFFGILLSQLQGQHLRLCDDHRYEHPQQPSREHRIIHVKQVADTNIKINPQHPNQTTIP